MIDELLELKEEMSEKREQNVSVSQILPRMRSIGRRGGNRKVVKEDDFLISRQIQEAVGRGHSGMNADHQRQQQSSFPKVTKSEDQGVTMRPRLVRKSNGNIGSQGQAGGQGVDGAVGVASSRGRGQKLGNEHQDLPSGAVASLIERNVGRGHRLDLGTTRSLSLTSKENSQKAKNSNNNNFPIFDYQKYKKLTQPAWWANTNKDDTEVNLEENATVVNKVGKAKGEKAVLSTWIPLNDSVEEELQD